MELMEEMNNGEIIQKGIEDFKNIQRHMLIAKEENATKTYASLKDDYISLKTLLNSLGVNMTDIDKIKEQQTYNHITQLTNKSVKPVPSPERV